MVSLPGNRVVNLGAFAACVGAMAAALFLQHVEGLEPCPLCILQRVGVIAAAVFFLLAGVHNPGPAGQRLYAGLAGLSAIGGGAVAIRHLWLQSLPEDQVPACGPGLEYMMDVFPLQEVLSMILQGSGECAEESWRFLGLTIPGWTLLVFVGLLAVALVQLFRRHA
jgi:disulfide bond formation protein DsbB